MEPERGSDETGPRHIAIPRPAATVVPVREGLGGFEVLLVRRPAGRGFAAGAWVFPGGVVDPADRLLDLDRLALGRGGRWWAARLGISDPSEAAGYLAAALREAWEETGIAPIAEAEPPGSGRLDRARRDLLAERASLAAVLEREGWHLDTREILYIAHWITPEVEPRRYDTRFFMIPVPAGAACVLAGEELVEARWIRPVDAVSGFRALEFRFLPPTIHTLERLAAHASVDELWEAMRDAPVRCILPRTPY